MSDQEDTLPFQITPSELFDAADKYFQATMANKRFEFQQKGVTGLTADNETAWAELGIVTWPPCKLEITVWAVPNGLKYEVEFVGDLTIVLGQRDELEDAWSQFLRSLPVEQQPSFDASVDSAPVAKIQTDSGQESKRFMTPNLDTEYNIERLIKKRQKAINRTGKAPGWLATCAEIPIESSTVMLYAKELRTKWDDIEFQPDPGKYNIGDWEN